MMQSDLDKLLAFDEATILSKDSIQKLEKELAQNPWFQAAHLLLAKVKFHQNVPDYDATLSKAAAYALDRTQLFNLIYHQDFTHVTNKETKPKTDKVEIPTVVKAKDDSAEVKSKEALEKKIADRLKQIEKEKATAVEEKAKEEKIRVEVTKPKATTEEAKPSSNQEKEVKPAEKIETVKKETVASAVEGVKPLVEEQAKDDVQVAFIEEKEDSVKIEALSLEEENRRIDEAEREKMQERIIDRFMKEQPSVNRPSDADYKLSSQKAKESLEDRLDFVSETLAKIYLNQGNKKKAKEIYKQLSLKYPEKKRYFAAQIQNLNK